MEGSFSASAQTPKRAKKMTLEEKMEVLDKLETGLSASEVCKLYGVHKSTVYYIKSKANEIRASASFNDSKSDQVAQVVRDKAIVKMEKALSLWFEDIVQEPETSGDICPGTRNKTTFAASKGRFDNFRKRFALRNVRLKGKTESADHQARDVYPVFIPQEQCPLPVITDIGQPVTVSDTDLVITAVGSNDESQNSIHPFDATEMCVSSPSVFDVSQEVQTFNEVDQPKQSVKQTDMGQISPSKMSSQVITDVDQPVTVSDTDLVVTAVGSNDERQNSIHPFDATEVCVSSSSVSNVSQEVQTFNEVDQPKQLVKQIGMGQIIPLKRSSRMIRRRKWSRETTDSSVEDQKFGLVTDKDSMAPNSKIAKSDSNVVPHAVLQEVIVFPQSKIAVAQKKKQTLVVPNHQVAVMSNLLSMWKAGQLCDSYISNGSTKIMVHKMVLGAVCPKLLPVLHSTSSSVFPTVTFPSSISKEGMLAFAEYMYSGVLDLNQDILVQLKTSAQILNMKDFEQLCSSELHKAKAASILSPEGEPLLAEPCTMSELLPSSTQKTTDPRHSQNTTLSPLLKLSENINISNSSNSQGVVSMDNMAAVGDLSLSSSSPTFRSAVGTTTAGQVIDIKTELESDNETIMTNVQQLKMEPCSPIRDQVMPPAGNSSTSRGDGLPISYSTNHYGSQSNLASSEVMYITNLHHSEDNQLPGCNRGEGGADSSNNAGDGCDLQLVSITSVTKHCTIPSDIEVTTSIDNLVSHNSGLVNIASNMATNTDLSTTASNSIPYPVGLFTADGSKITQVIQDSN